MNIRPNMKFFEYAQLPEHLQAVSRPYCEAALALVRADELPTRALSTDALPENNERDVAASKLRKAVTCLGWQPETDALAHTLRLLLEAKDAAVRSALLGAG